MAFSLLPNFLCFLSLLPFLVLAQNKTNIISLGHSFSASDNSTPWVVSPSGDFAFGFRAVGDVFYLSIWYAKIPDPDKTIVWYANRDNPAPKGSKVQVTADSGLLLTSPDGEELWKPETLIGTVSDAVLNDSGNFILRDANSGRVWETFKNPRDTILPSQLLEKGGRLNSRLSEGNFSKGRFELLLDQDGNLVFHSINLPSEYVNENYYESKTVGSNTSSPGHQLVFNKSGSVYILRENNEIFNISSGGGVSSSDYYLRATMDSDGVFILYKHPKSSSGTEGWTAVWSQPDNICTASLVSAGIGVCGYNSICTLSADKRPICQCLRDYSPLDPTDPHGSCKADFIQGCEEDSLSPGKNLYEFVEYTDTDWPLSDSVLQKPFTEDECKQSCMEDCLCAVAIFRLGDSCWKKKLPLSNGRVDSSLNGGKAFIKVRKGNFSLSGSGSGSGPGPGPPIILKKNQNTLILVLSVLLGGSGCLNLVLILAICLSFSIIYKHHKKLEKINRNGNTVETNLRCFSYKELEEATNGFKEELGRGAFGIVYKGDLGLGLVAVKKLHTFLLQDIEREFRNEVKIIGLTHHKNLVRLLGFCEDGAERLLVYEYMSNGTLANLLFNETNSKPSWNVRLRIAFGIARGLLYLHEECSTQIIHCDIKPQNILLDDYYNARISDFGLAKLLNMNQSRTNTGIRGTKGYVALEWFKNRPITAKVDVYSFGVLLLEIICCRKNVNVESDNEELAILTDWAYDCYKEGTLSALVENDNEAWSDRKNLENFVMVAIWCTQEDPANRPTMRKVTQMLEGVVEVPDPPCPYQFSVTQDIFLSVNVSGNDQF